ncbi:MAG TPA: hypothetical protein VM183_13135 [Burkholderiales bacterium]|nr:hypothetical protein [Burkholderiales bacterium]
MSLAVAAAIAYAALRDFMHPGSHRVSVAEYHEALHLLASHIGIVAPIFGAGAEGASMEPISREVLAEGHFAGGALRLEFADARAPYTDLAIRKGDLDAIIEKLRAAFRPVMAGPAGRAGVARVALMRKAQ